MSKERLEHFLKERSREQRLFVPYIMAGDGGLETLADRMLFLQECGVAGIEVGIPFSDPIADGPTIQNAGQRALKNGTSLDAVLKTLDQFKEKRTIPTVIMAYFNVIYSYGIDSFSKTCKEVGVDGIIVPDVPLEEENILTEALDQHNIAYIRLVALTSPIERIKKIAERAEGFLYAVSVTGTTGARTTHEAHVADYLSMLKEYAPVPVLAGFGVSTPEQVIELSKHGDGVIVGSKIVDLFHQNKHEEIKQFIKASLA